jgi:hypothetical protein
MIRMKQIVKVFTKLDKLIDNKNPLIKPIYIGKTTPLLEQLAIVCENEEQARVFTHPDMQNSNPLNYTKTYSICGYSGLQKYELHVILKDWQFIPFNLVKTHQILDYFRHEKINVTHPISGIGIKKHLLRKGYRYDLFEEKTYKIRSHIKNRVLPKSVMMLTKLNIYKSFPRFTPQCENVDLIDDIDNILSIVKPINGTHGNDIVVVSNNEEYFAAINHIRKVNTGELGKYLGIVVCKYISNADCVSLKDLNYTSLIDSPNYRTKRKYHVRTYLMISNFGYYSCKTSHIWLAKDKYELKDWANRAIHDSRHSNNEADFSIDETDWRYDELEKLKYEIGMKACQNVKGYLESRNFYEIMGLDIMFDTNKKAWLIECNLTPGMEGRNPDDPMFKAFQKQMFDWEYSCIKHIFYTYVVSTMTAKNLGITPIYNNITDKVLNTTNRQLTIIGDLNECKRGKKGHKYICISDRVIECDFIIARNTNELNEFIMYPTSLPPMSTGSYSIPNSIPKLTYHKYFKNWDLVSGESTFYLFNNSRPLHKSQLTSIVDNVDVLLDKSSLYRLVKEYTPKQYEPGETVDFPCIVKTPNTVEWVCGKPEQLYEWIGRNNIKNIYTIYQYIPQDHFRLKIHFCLSSWGKSELYPYYQLITDQSIYVANKTIDDQIKEIYNIITKGINPKPYPESKLAYEVFSMTCMVTKKEKVILLKCSRLMGSFQDTGLIDMELSFIRDVFEVNIRQRELSIVNSLRMGLFDNKFTSIYWHSQQRSRQMLIKDIKLESSKENSHLFKELVRAGLTELIDVWVHQDTLLSDRAYIDELIDAGKKDVKVLDIEEYR